MQTPRTHSLRLAAGIFALAGLALLPGCFASHASQAWGFLTSLTLVCGPLMIMGVRAFFCDDDDFTGDRVYSATKGSNVGHGYTITDTSAAGAPTIVTVDGSESGEVAVTFDATVEAQNVCISLGDKLQYSIDRIVEVYARVKVNAAVLDSATSFAIGVTGDRNDAIDTIPQAALFRVIGSNAIVVETDDGTHDNDDVATGKALGLGYADLLISFAAGKSDVRFFVNGQPVGTGTTFDMSAYSGSLQLFAQIQKTADANVDGFVLDRWYVRGRKALLA